MRSDDNVLKPVAVLAAMNSTTNERENNFDSRNVATLVQHPSHVISNSTTIPVEIPNNMQINF